MTDALLLGVAAATGAAVMVLELMGVRLAAPWFGQSQLVWTNVIGVVLACLAVGQWLGGRWAEDRRGPGPAALLVAAGGFALALPEIVAWLAPLALPADLALLEAHPFVVLGSLLVALVGLGLPMLALGAVTPWLVRLSRDAQSRPGHVAGRLLGAGTLGSLVGTFSASHLLLPLWGSAGAVRTAGALLALAGLALWSRADRRVHGAALLWLLMPVLALVLPTSERQRRAELLEERETAYQWARVVSRPDGSRALALNEGLDSFHSLWTPDPLHSGAYYDAFLQPALASPLGADGRRHILVLGLAAGTMARQILAADSSAQVTGVEIDPEIVELGRRWFELPAAVAVRAGVDARVAVVHDHQRYGAVLIDAYAQQIYLPAHLCTQEFFLEVRQRLLPGGVVALNVGGLSIEDPVVEAVSGTLASVFGSARVGRVPGTRNMIVVARDGDEPVGESGVVPPELAPSLAWMQDAERMSVVLPTGRSVLRDGHAPLEALAHASWSGTWSAPASFPRDDGAGLAPLDRGRRLVRQTRWTEADAVLAPLASSGDPALRAEAGLLMGNVAFERGQEDRALLIYETALRTRPGRPDDDLVGRALTTNLVSARGALERRRALAHEERGVLAAVVGLALLMLSCVTVAAARLR